MYTAFEYYVELTCAPESPGFAGAAAQVWDQVCRRDFSRPGFMLLNLSAVDNSFQLRRFMLHLQQHLQGIHRRSTGRDLICTSLGRFDQQETTKLHRDGGLDESLLVLGYEPTIVASSLSIADYTKCAHERNMSPKQFLENHNPMYAEGEQLLADFTVQLEGLDPQSHQILVINNSCAPLQGEASGLLGVLHKTVIPEPTPNAMRIVNSMMIAPVDPGVAGAITEEDLERFLTTDRISKPV